MAETTKKGAAKTAASKFDKLPARLKESMKGAPQHKFVFVENKTGNWFYNRKQAVRLFDDENGFQTIENPFYVAPVNVRAKK